jgi:hypothetical protein
MDTRHSSGDAVGRHRDWRDNRCQLRLEARIEHGWDIGDATHQQRSPPPRFTRWPRGIFMQPTGDYLNILKIKPAMCTTRASVDYFADSVDRILSEGL